MAIPSLPPELRQALDGDPLEAIRFVEVPAGKARAAVDRQRPLQEDEEPTTCDGCGREICRDENVLATFDYRLGRYVILADCCDRPDRGSRSDVCR